jgi:hypothetical protein
MKGEPDELSSTLEQVVLTKNGNLRMPPRSELHTHIYLIIFLLYPERKYKPAGQLPALCPGLSFATSFRSEPFPACPSLWLEMVKADILLNENDRPKEAR